LSVVTRKSLRCVFLVGRHMSRCDSKHRGSGSYQTTPFHSHDSPLPNGVERHVRVTKCFGEPFAGLQLCKNVTANFAHALAEAAPTMSDEEIVRRVLEGEVSLFELLIRRHNQRLYRATRSILKDNEEAEDVMQEAYVRAFTHLDQFAGEAKFSTWLTKIAVYEALGRLRRRKQMDNIPEGLSGGGNPEDTTYKRELQSLIEAAIDVLPPLYRSVFLLREVEEMSGAEVAECLGITQETAKTRLHRARRMLRDELRTSLGDAVSKAYSYGSAHCDRMTASTMERVRELAVNPGG
jgi:RNA polymerase sigma-70 factor, ECF subfamily